MTLYESRRVVIESPPMRTEFHGWRNPRKGFHWINIVDGFDCVWLWFCENAARWLRRKEGRQELERDLDSIRNIKPDPHKTE